jgi:hypothetical protein
MKTWKVILRPIILAFLILTPQLGFGQIVAWQFGSPASTGTEATYNATTNDPNLKTSILSRGVGLNTPIAFSRGFVDSPWNTAGQTAAQTIGSYFQFTIQASSGYRVSLSTLDAKLISYKGGGGSSGPNRYIWRYSVDDGISFNDIGSPITLTPTSSTSTTGSSQAPITLSSISNLQNISSASSIIFRIYAWGATNTGNNGYFGFGKTPVSPTTNCLAIGGTVEQLTLSTSTSIINVPKTSNYEISTAVTSNTDWTATSDQNWLTVNSAGNGNGTLTCTTTSLNPLITERIATVTLSAKGLTDRTVTVVQAVGDATLSVSTPTANVSKIENSSASLDVTSNSTWTATSDQNWLTVPSGATGNGTLTCTATANPTINIRTAIVTLKAAGASDRIVTVTQEAGDATLLVSSTTANVTKTANSSAIIDITSNSTWTATSDQNWLTVPSGATGNGTLTCTSTLANPTITTRSAIVTLKATGVSDKIVTVTQEAGDATLSVSAITANVTKTANSSAIIDITSNTTWTATSDQTWLTATSGATGNGTLTCTAAANPTINIRTAIVTLKATGASDKIVTVTQEAGDATLLVSSTTANVTKTANSSAIIDITSNSTWTATSDQTWLTATSGATGNGTLTCTATANPTIIIRTAIVTLKATGASDKIVTVTQEAGDATLSVSANTASVAKTANSSVNIDITSNTTWTSISDQSWLTVAAGGTGNSTLTFTAITTNPVITTRIAKVTIKATGTVDQVVTVTQAVGDATLSVSATTANIGNMANITSRVNIISNSPCSASSDQSWLLVKSSGKGDYSLPFYAVSANPLATTRQAIITITTVGAADKTITVTQAGADPTLEVSANTANVAKTSSANATLKVTSNTTWTTSSNQTWLSVTPGTTGNATVTFTTFAANPTITSRNAIVTFKATGTTDKIVTITQASGDTTLTVSASTASVLKSANSSTSINVVSNASWTATSDQNWLTITTDATGDATLSITANTTNPTIYSRAATVTVKATGAADKTITVTQAAGDATLSISETTASVSETANSMAWINISSNTSWTATSNQSWLTVTQGATGNGSLTFTAAENSAITARSATVTVKATGISDKTITVTQLANAPILKVSNNSVVLDPKANNTTSVNITSNTVWHAVSDQSWLIVSSGTNGNGVLTFSAANSTNVTRQAIVTISGTGVADYKVTVIQSSNATENKYQLNMTVTSIATIDNNEIANGDIQLSAFIGTECRGTTTLKYVESTKRYMVFLMVWGNAEDVNKTITFKSYDPISTNELTAINATLKFIPESITGSPTNPYSIDFAKKITEINVINNKNIEVYPNPIIDAFRIKGLVGIANINLTDMNGKILIHRQVNENEAISTQTLPKGMYLLQITNNDGVVKRKVVKQ